MSGLGVARTPIEPCAGASSSTAAPATPVARNFNSLAAVENGFSTHVQTPVLMRSGKVATNSRCRLASQRFYRIQAATQREALDGPDMGA